MDYGYIEKNVAATRKQIAAASEKSVYGKNVTLVAAVKYADIAEINHLVDVAGVRDIGENRVQQLLEHFEGLNDKSVNIHFIGTLQTNKVKYIVDKVCMIHSVDSQRLAAEIDKQAAKRGLRVKVLVEVNCGEEQSKSGVLPSEVGELCLQICSLESIELCGFMTMAPRCEDKSDYLRFFGDTYALVTDIWKNTLHREGEPIISMGMSESFCEAIASGADIVRVGRGLFVK